MKIAVIGTGYVGLVSGAGFSDFGHDVTCVDIDSSRVEALRRGECPIHEPGLPELVRRNAQLGRLRFTTSTAEAVPGALIVFIAVGTPSGSDGSADMQYVYEAARNIGRAINGFTVVVNKSTVPIGTADKVREIIAKETKHPFAVASNPEFLKEGDAVNDFLKPARVVLGTDDARALDLLREVYRGVMRTGDRIQAMDIRSAEMTKYAANAMLATRISFMNEVANVCESVGANVDEVRRAVAADRRIGPSFLFPGIGYGGSCFPKDVKAMLRFAAEKNYKFAILDAVEAVNERQKLRLLSKLQAQFGSLKGKQIALWGLAFKPRTDDMREAPAVPLIHGLLAAGASVHAYDPEAMKVARGIFGSKISYADNSYTALTGADALAIVTEWNEFREPDFARMRKLLRNPIIFDGRNLYNPEQIRAHGFTYVSIGRP
jgi:UDPglucose 6-dehydrogenase